MDWRGKGFCLIRRSTATDVLLPNGEKCYGPERKGNHKSRGIQELRNHPQGHLDGMIYLISSVLH